MKSREHNQHNPVGTAERNTTLQTRFQDKGGKVPCYNNDAYTHVSPDKDREKREVMVHIRKRHGNRKSAATTPIVETTKKGYTFGKEGHCSQIEGG